MTSDHTIVIELTESQARILSWASENISRLQMNQFDVLTEICHRRNQPWPNHDDMRDIEYQLKQIFSPELSLNSYWGIYSPEISNRARTLFDIHQAIRYHLSWSNNPINADWTVDYDEPFHTDTTSPIPKVYTKGDSTSHIYLSFFRRLQHSIKQMIDKHGWKKDSVEYNEWIEKCKAFAIYENNRVIDGSPVPSNEYLKFFNEKLTDDGKYIVWRGDDV